MNFHVVEFLEENGVDVSDAWMVGKDMCHWPPLRSSARIAQAVKDHTKPEKSWPKFPCRIMYTASTYEKARKKLNFAEETSDINTSADEQERSPGKRKIRKNSRYESETSDDDTSTSKSSPKKKTARLPSAPPTPTFQLVCSPRPRPSTDAPSTSVETASPQIENLQVLQSQSASPSRDSVLSLPARPHRESTANISETERRMFFLLEEIVSAQKTLESKVDKLLCSAKEDPLEESSIIDELGFPLNSLPDLEGVDKKLKEDSKLEKRLLFCLSLIGGRKADDTVRRTMAQCLSNTLALQCNWKGRNNKKAFSTLHLNKVIQRAIHKNPLTKLVTTSEVEEVQKSCLRFAGDRDGKRKNRSGPIANQ